MSLPSPLQMMSTDNQQELNAAWTKHLHNLKNELPRIRPLWWVVGWTVGLPAAVALITGNHSIAALLWWALMGYLVVTAWYDYWRQKALAGCYISMSDAFASYVMENDDIDGALTWQMVLYEDKRRLKILAVPFPTIQDRDDAADRAAGF